MEKRRNFKFKGGPKQGSGKKRSGGFSGSSSFRGDRNGSRGHGGRNFGGGRNRGKQHKSLDINFLISQSKAVGQPEEKFVPEHSFGDFAVDSRIKKVLESRGYTQPTQIQDKAISHILNGEDVVGLANTGTGKTAAFLIPLVDKIIKCRDEKVLVLAPTRELAIQIGDELMFYARALNLNFTVCVGGASIGNQIRQLRRHNHFVIGTPGRVMDLMKRNVLNVNNVKNVVLDEADRMLDMGFVDSVRLILGKVQRNRHTLCFSATLPSEIKKLISDFMNSPITISVKTQDIPKNITQDVVRVNGRKKSDMLADYLRNPEFARVIVFGRTKRGVENLSRDLNRYGFNTEAIHGNRSHAQRQRALKKFKDNQVQALIATDVAARGLDISGVTHVINYDVPETYDDYVHRIGRTGRGVQTGNALTFVG
jgi:ATP-dependent RNA helicase RhlE